MAKIQNRYVMSALSKKRKEISVPKEIMMDRETGEIQIKSEDGNIISYNYLNRLNSHIDTLVFNSYNADIYGEIYELEIDNLDLPCRVEHYTNILDGELIIAEGDFKSFMLSIDIDSICPSDIISTLDSSEIPIELTIGYTVGNSKTMVTITEPAYKINRMKITKNDLHQDAIQPTIKSVKIGEVDSLGDTKIIVYSVLVNVEE